MLLWILAIGIPIAGLFFFARSKVKKDPRNQAYDPKTGLGRGAPGFQTNIKRIAVPPEIIARIRAGEEVSAEEITRAQEKMQREEAKAAAAAEAAESPSKKKKKGGKK
ncbi:uncharacterized protein FA14DRAFT_192045 [Meira miltonrushii]|uniref:Uncharacterized protein n=1 Tax=Meira miltonrushii TaxID=1280837 RepID=A0A316V6E0_9BASI|nr:uncharacterized protein FA14DRAFT_192045 [Meira miltonrushii]PWN33002.1 hypothetical protein FA14DRAFT_192045 [Meira miltonrushii]